MDPHNPNEENAHGRVNKNPLDKLKQMLSKIPHLLKNLISHGPVAGIINGGSNALGKILSPLESRLPAGIREILVNNRPKIFLGLVAIVLLFGAKSCFFSGKAAPKISLEDAMKQQQGKAEEAAVPIKGFKVGRFNFEDSLNALGTIKGAVEFKLSFEVPGTVSSINYREGERYEEGALLISLRQDDILLRLKRAQAEFNKAQTQSHIAEEKVKEHEKLFSMGAIPKTTLENVKLELESTNYEAEANRLEVKANEAMLEKSNLYAPSAGMIGELSIEEGETITPNTLLGTHIMTEYVYAEFGVVERDVNKIALGQKARVFVDAYPDKTFEGVIENVAPVVAGTSRTATARVRVENPDRLLLPGMFARIRILLYSKKNTLVIPTDSIQGSEGEQFVYVVHSEQGPLIQKSSEKSGEEAPASSSGSALSAGQESGEEGEVQQENQSKGETGISSEQSEGSRKKGEKSGKNKESESGNEEQAAKKKENLTVKKRPITVGYTRPDYCQIDAGLSEGEIVAISGLERLEDGKKIRLLETQEAEI